MFRLGGWGKQGFWLKPGNQFFVLGSQLGNILVGWENILYMAHIGLTYAGAGAPNAIENQPLIMRPSGHFQRTPLPP